MMIDQKKLTRYRRKYIKQTLPILEKEPWKDLINSLDNTERVALGEIEFKRFHSRSSTLWMKYIAFYTLAAIDADLEKMRLNYAVAISLGTIESCAKRDILNVGDAKAANFNASSNGRITLLLQGAGWFEEAKKQMDFVCTNAKVDFMVSNRNKLGWFAILSTFDDWDHFKTIERKGYYPPNINNIDIYWMLAECWDDPDPLKVKNTLTAVREHNVAGNLMAEFSTPDTNDELLLFFDYEVRAINMRRMALGLETVVLDESYAIEPQLPMERIPFAKDDVVWPAYLKTCEHFGTKPYEPKGEVINVTLDRTTGVASLV